MAYQRAEIMRNRNCENLENSPLKHYKGLAKEAPSTVSCPQVVREENMYIITWNVVLHIKVKRRAAPTYTPPLRAFSVVQRKAEVASYIFLQILGSSQFGLGFY